LSSLSERADAARWRASLARALANLETRDVLLLALFAAAVLGLRAAMRWHVHVPGHAMAGTAFALVIARGCLPLRSAATLCGALAGVGTAAFGMGKGGPLLIAKLALPGIAIDAGSALLGARARGDLRAGALLGAAAGATGFAPVVAIELLAGVDPSLIAWHAATAAGAKALFGAVGGAAGAVVVRELVHHGVVEERARASG